MRKKLGEYLLQAGLISPDDLRRALAEPKRPGERLGGVLVRLRLTTEEQIARALAQQLGFPYVNLAQHPIDAAAVALVPKEIALRRVCLAIKVEKNTLTLAMADPQLLSVVQDLEFQTGRRITQTVATPGDILRAIEAYYPETALATRQPPPGDDRRVKQPAKVQSAPLRAAPSGSSLVRRADDDVFEAPASVAERNDATPVIELVDLIVKSAIQRKASDVHIEPMDGRVAVRHRLDGLLTEVMDLPRWVHEALIARMKVMSGMDIAEKRLPQDGRLRVTTDDGTPVDFRISTLRTMFGEKIVLRVLDHRKGVPPLTEIGLSAAALPELREFLRCQHGMILVVGPTGSGKTTTLSAAIQSLKSKAINITTIEDPIEYQLVGVNQTQINEKVKLTFASALRSILRQDPDVIMLGEIRDSETASIAMKAALTGHLVLSSLHTDDAPSAITRLHDIGVERYVIASALVGVVAQRLVRRLCPECRRPHTPAEDTLRTLNLTGADAAGIVFYRAVGCEHCHQTGYLGRVGVYEVMRVSDRIRRLIMTGASDDQIREAAETEGMISLGEDGLAKLRSGVTTIEELLRVVTNSREIRTLCAGCGTAMGIDFVACPQCGKRQNTSCPHCRRPLQPGWNFCPYCARGTAEPPRRERLRAQDVHVTRNGHPHGTLTPFKRLAAADGSPR